MTKTSIASTLAATCCWLSPAHGEPTPAASAAWPQFRGPGFLGTVADHPRLPERWSQEKNIAWKTKVPGRGWSSPVVWGNRVFLTTAINSGDSEPPKPGLYFGGNRPKVETLHEWKVLCYDLVSGQPSWEHSIQKGVPPEARHLKNSFASETPITDGERLYAYVGNVGFFTFSMDGKPLWNRKWDPVKTRYGWGTAASPFLHQGVLYLINDNDEQSFLTALDAATGNLKWRVDREEGSNWSPPFVWENSKRTELVTTGSGKVRSYDLEGKLLWTLTGFSSITVPAPFAHGDLLYIGSGYVGDKKRPFMAVKPGASGDISLADGETSNAHVAWSHPRIAPYMPTPLVYRDRLYILLDRGMMSCYNAVTGEEIYDRKRLGRHGEFTASPLAYNGKVFCFSERGNAVAIKAGDTFEVTDVSLLDEMIMATPAISGDRLLIRTIDHLYCIQKPPPSGGEQVTEGND